MLKRSLYVVTGLILISLIVALIGCAAPAPTTPAAKPAPAPAAPSAADFYKGKTVKFLVAAGTGGGTDRIARLSADWYAKVTGAKVVVENMDGANGVVGCNYMYKKAEPDGLTVGLCGALLMEMPWILKDPAVEYDIAKFAAIGGLSPTNFILLGGPNSPYTSIEALQKGKNIKFATLGATQPAFYASGILIEALGLDARIISGYKGTPEVTLALTQGECDVWVATCSTANLDIVPKFSFKPIVTVTLEKDSIFPNVPYLGSAKLTDTQKKLINMLPTENKTYFVPQGVPADRVTFLKTSFEAMCKNPDFQKDVEKAFKVWEGYLTGQQANDDLQKVAKSRADYETMWIPLKKYEK